MKLKKIVALLLSVVTVGSCLSFTACKKDGIIDDGKTVNIQITKSGYGEEYIKEMAAAFEEVYAEEGYKINILEPDPNFGTTQALNAMRLADASGYDIVFPGSVFIEDVVDHVEFGTIVESLDDIYKLPAIDFEGNEESKTLEQKLARLVATESGKRAICTPDGKYWGFARVGSVRGVVTNTKVLEQNGLDFEEDYPYTTDQFLDCMHKISANDMRPMIWGGDNAATYSVGTVLTSLRQIMTDEEYAEFSTFYKMYEDAGDKIPKDGWKYRIYHDALQPTMEFLMETWDTQNAMEGSYGMRHDDAHGYLMLGQAAYMFDGEYFYNEVRVNYPEYLDDIRMMNRPVSSYLGLRLELCGKDHNVGYSDDRNVDVHCADCDKMLALGCKMYDEDKSAADIKTALQALNANVTDFQVAEIMRARGVAYGGPASGYIMKASDVKDIAKLFLRMLASDDAAEVYAKSGMLSAFSTAGLSSDVDEFVKDCFRIDRQWTSIGDTHGDPYAPASRMGFVLSPYSATVGKNVNDFMSDKDRDYGVLAKECLKTVVEAEHQKNWENWITTKASLTVGDEAFNGYTGNR